MFWHKFPYTDAHELNLDYILARIKEMHKEISEFEAVNKITNAGAWDITKQYQAWTIVSDNNVGYISLQPVPAGVAITNTDYWGLVADYDILITDLSNRISYLEGQDIINKERMTTIESDEIICLGDSYGVDAQAGGKAWSSYVADVHPDAHISCIGGLGFASDVYLTPPDNFLTVLQGMTIAHPKRIKSIFIFSGANDANLYLGGVVTLDDIKGRIIAFCDYVKNTYENAKVYVGFISWHLAANHADPYCKVRELYEQTCSEIENATYISGIEPIMRNIDFINPLDQVHPTATASGVLGEYINSAITTKGSVHYHKRFDTTFTKSASITDLLDISDSKEIIYDGYNVQLKVFGTKNNYHHIDLRLPSVTVRENISLVLGRFSNMCAGEGLPPSAYMPVLVLDGGTLKTMNARFEIDNTTGDLRMYCLDDVVYNSVIEILIPSPLVISATLR